MRYSHYLGVCLLISVSALARAGAGELAIVPANVDLGSRPQNQAATAVVELTNSAMDPITILQVVGDCSCTTGQLTESRLAPGASSRLTVRLETRATEGRLRHNLFLITTAGRQVIPVTALVYHYRNWTITPPRLTFAPSLRGTEAKAQLSFVYGGGGAPKMVSATVDSPWFSVGPPQTDGNRITLSIRKISSAPSGSNLGDLRLATQDPVSPILQVPVVAEVR